MTGKTKVHKRMDRVWAPCRILGIWLLFPTGVLEDRLNVKKEQLLEKELVLEEVGSLSERLRFQAVEGREETLDIAKTVNEFQARIKKVTRRLMACVSELSMYQVCVMCQVCVMYQVSTFKLLPLSF